MLIDEINDFGLSFPIVENGFDIYSFNKNKPTNIKTKKSKSIIDRVISKRSTKIVMFIYYSLGCISLFIEMFPNFFNKLKLILVNIILIMCK